MAYRFCNLAKISVVVLLVALGAGCSTLPPGIPGYPEGDAAARRKTRKLAVVGFIVNYRLGPNINLKTVFTPGTRYQKNVERMYMYFADELNRSRYFRVLPAAKVKGDRFYRGMEINQALDSRLSSTCPKGLRMLAPRDGFDYEGLCRSLGVDGVVMLELGCGFFSSVFTRSAELEVAELLALGKDGTILYRRTDASQYSGASYFAEYAWLRKKTYDQDLYNLEKATRALARDFTSAFAPR